MPRISM